MPADLERALEEKDWAKAADAAARLAEKDTSAHAWAWRLEAALRRLQAEQDSERLLKAYVEEIAALLTSDQAAHAAMQLRLVEPGLADRIRAALRTYAREHPRCFGVQACLAHDAEVRGETDEAIALREHILLFSTETGNLNWLASHYGRKQDVAALLRVDEALIASDPGHASSYLMHEIGLQLSARNEAALPLLVRRLESAMADLSVENRADVLIQYGYTLTSAGRLTEAASCFSRIESDRQYPLDVRERALVERIRLKESRTDSETETLRVLAASAQFPAVRREAAELLSRH